MKPSLRHMVDAAGAVGDAATARVSHKQAPLLVVPGATHPDYHERLEDFVTALKVLIEAPA